jgi:hypothetical protein
MAMKGLAKVLSHLARLKRIPIEGEPSSEEDEAVHIPHSEEASNALRVLDASMSRDSSMASGSFRHEGTPN